MRAGRGFYRILVGRLRPLGRPRPRWEDNIKTDLREIGIEGANWILLAQDSPVVCFSGHGNEPSGSIKQNILTSCVIISWLADSPSMEPYKMPVAFIVGTGQRVKPRT
jgi:hypothetical protein